MLEPIFTAEQLSEVHAYHAPHYAWGAWSVPVRVGLTLAVATLAVGPLYRASAALSGWSSQRAGWLKTAPGARGFLRVLDRLWGEPGWGAAVLFALGQFLVLELALLPKDVLFGYLHEHRFGLSRYTPATFAWDLVKGASVHAAATALLAFGLYGLARRVRRWWLLLGAVVAALMLVAAALDTYRARLFFDQHPLPAGALRDRITSLLREANVEFDDVLVERTSRVSKKLDAYFAGQGPTRAVVLSDVLLEELTADEVLAVVAHEAGHVHERRWPGRLAAMAGAVVFLFLVDRLLRWAAGRKLYGATAFADIRTLPLVTVLFLAVTVPVEPFSLALSRRREARADEYALSLTRDPAAFRSMLVKAARVNKMDPDPPSWYVLLHMGHPPVGERIAVAERALAAAPPANEAR